MQSSKSCNLLIVIVDFSAISRSIHKACKSTCKAYALFRWRPANEATSGYDYRSTNRTNKLTNWSNYCNANNINKRCC